MYGCSNAVLVYGFNMGNREYIIDSDYVDNMYPGVSLFAEDIVRHYLGEAVYGVCCNLNNETGEISVLDEDKQMVIKLYEKYVEYVKGNYGERMLLDVTLGFRLVVSGDYGMCHDIIVLDDEYVSDVSPKSFNYDFIKDEDGMDEEGNSLLCKLFEEEVEVEVIAEIKPFTSVGLKIV